MSDRKPSCSEFTVGWLCALSHEMTACRMMLDIEYHGVENIPLTDTNTYIFGSICQHMIVITCLPEGNFGTTPAARSTTHMLGSFPHIRFGVLVGVGGGIPSDEHDIRLGDVVVSKPNGTNGGVVKYDSGKRVTDGFQHTGSLNKPPTELLSAVSLVKSENDLERSKMPKFLARLRPKFHKPTEPDVLYKATYQHQGQSKTRCDECAPDSQLPRIDRDNDYPVIHYGTIASGDEVVKDPRRREELARKFECLCCETEAAGIMNDFPCIVVRGVADYCDSHKNKLWQPYAAGTAAAWARELLETVNPSVIKTMPRALEQDVAEIKTAIEGVTSLTRKKEIKDWLKLVDPSLNYNVALEKRHEGSGETFRRSRPFNDWQKRKTLPFLWLHGKAGCGKTVLSASVIEHLTRSNILVGRTSNALAYFYFDFQDEQKTSHSSLVRSVAYQLSSVNNDLWAEMVSLYTSCKSGDSQPADDALERIIKSCIEHYTTAWIVIDALDECQTLHSSLTWIQKLLSAGTGPLKLLMISRDEHDIRVALQEKVTPICFVSIDGDILKPEIQAYVHARLFDEKDFEMWRGHPILEEVERAILSKVDGMFRWAACQLDELQDCIDLAQLRRELASLPRSLDQTYGRILTRIKPVLRSKAIILLQLMMISSRPLRLSEAVDVMAVDLEGKSFDPEHRMPQPMTSIRRICPNLITLSCRQAEYDDAHRISRYKVDFGRECHHVYGGRDCDGYCEVDGVDEDYMTAKRDIEYYDVRFTHSTVKEYLQSSKLEAIYAAHFLEPTVMGCVVRACLIYLLQLHRAKYEGKALLRELPWAKHAAQHCFLNASTVCVRDDEHYVTPLMHQLLASDAPFDKLLTVWDPDYELEQRKDGAFHQTRRLRPLYYASLAGITYSVSQFIGDGNIDAVGGYYENALFAAASRRHFECLRLLLLNGGDPNCNAYRGPQREFATAIQVAIEKGWLDMVEMLIDYGASHTPSYFGLVHAAVVCDQVKIASVMLNRGVNIAKGDFSEAASRGNRVMLQLLLDHGADINEAVSRNKNKIRAEFDGTPLEAAVQAGRLDCAEWLLQKGADIKSSPSPLLAAVHRGAAEIVKFVLDLGADINAGAGTTGTALQAATSKGHKNIVELLLQNGADVDAESNFSRNELGPPLLCACLRGREDLVYILIKAKANLNVYGCLLGTSHYGNAIQLSFHKGYDHIVDILLEAGARPSYKPPPEYADTFREQQRARITRPHYYEFPTFHVFMYREKRDDFRRSCAQRLEWNESTIRALNERKVRQSVARYNQAVERYKRARDTKGKSD